MMRQARGSGLRIDIIGLILAGLINSFLALLVAGFVLAPGTSTGQADLLQRAQWIAEHTERWQAGWLFWFAVTLSFSWSFFALGRHLDSTRPWRLLAIGLALIAAAVDLVGVLINMTVVPVLAGAMTNPLAYADPSVGIVFSSMEQLAYALTNVAAFGLYSLAGLLMLPAIFATIKYPRWLAWLGVAEWGIASIATCILVFAPDLATVPLLVSFLLYAPWVWGSALWFWRSRPATSFVDGLSE